MAAEPPSRYQLVQRETRLGWGDVIDWMVAQWNFSEGVRSRSRLPWQWFRNDRREES
jgi:hypothetical protein